MDQKDDQLKPSEDENSTTTTGEGPNEKPPGPAPGDQ